MPDSNALKWPISIRDDEDLMVLFDRFIFVQGKKGQRSGIDAVVLAEHSATDFAVPTLEIGTGCGVTAILLAIAKGQGPIVAIEIQASLADRATRNVKANNVEDIVRVVHGDIRDAALFAPCSFRRIVSNPPFFPKGCGRISPDYERANARHEIMVNMTDMMTAIARLLTKDGVASVLYPWSRLEKIRSVSFDAGLTLFRVTPGTPAPSAMPVIAICDMGFGPPQEAIIAKSVSLDRIDHNSAIFLRR